MILGMAAEPHHGLGQASSGILGAEVQRATPPMAAAWKPDPNEAGMTLAVPQGRLCDGSGRSAYGGF